MQCGVKIIDTGTRKIKVDGSLRALSFKLTVLCRSIYELWFSQSEIGTMPRKEW